jgi:hypothetical protein
VTSFLLVDSINAQVHFPGNTSLELMYNFISLSLNQIIYLLTGREIGCPFICGDTIYRGAHDPPLDPDGRAGQD